MNLQTINSASRALDIPAMRIRKAAADGVIDVLRVGNRMLVDLDEVSAKLRCSDRYMGIRQVCDAIGLNESAIRRGIRDGWIPCKKVGKKYIFDLDDVKRAIRARMSETE